MAYNDGFELLFALGTKKHPVAPQPHHANISQDFPSRDARGEIALSWPPAARKFIYNEVS
jgi:hypothetical protein